MNKKANALCVSASSLQKECVSALLTIVNAIHVVHQRRRVLTFYIFVGYAMTERVYDT